jgi:glutathione reductase (NADPH)
MNQYDCDLFVIGAGSGGVRAGRIASSLGARVAVAENYRIGGTCVIRGCVPKKLLVFASHFGEDFEDAAGFGWRVEGREFSWARLIENKNIEIERLSTIYAGLLADAGVDVLTGTARLVDSHTVTIGERRVSAKYVLVAAGGGPRMPAVPGIEHAISSNEAFELPELPRRILIVGGGYVAMEFAGIFRGLGSEVTISYRGEEILRGFDEDVRRHLHQELHKKGIRILLNSRVTRIDRRSRGVLEASVPGMPDEKYECDAVMYATGRVPNTGGLGLSEAGVRLDEDGGVVVDRFGQSSVPSVYAIGDVTNRIALTPVAIREGAAVAMTLFGAERVPVDHEYVPSAVFSQPPVGTVGLNQDEAEARFGDAEVYKTSFRPLRHTLSGRDERTLVKLVVDPATQRVVGAHMVGADAPEIIQGIAIAVKAGLTKTQFDATLGIHPTAAEEFVTMKEKTVVGKAASAARG